MNHKTTNINLRSLFNLNANTMHTLDLTIKISYISNNRADKNIISTQITIIYVKTLPLENQLNIYFSQIIYVVPAFPM